MNKTELKKIKPGTLLVIRWTDSPDTVALLLDKPDWSQKGDISLHCFQLDNKGIGYTDNRIQHNQVVEIIDNSHVDSLMKEIQAML